jgi:hypothetical protein
MPAMMEYEFTLPRGYVDAAGQVHRHGRMRLATARDEIESMQHPYVQASEAYLSVVLLSRVVTALGEQVNITPQLMADLFAVDITFLEDLYQRLNTVEGTTLAVVCPHCNQSFALEMAPMAWVEA